MPPPEKFKCKLLKPDADGDGRTDRYVIYVLATIFRMAGHKNGTFGYQNVSVAGR